MPNTPTPPRISPLDQLLRCHRRLEQACDALSIASSDRDLDTAVDVCGFFARQVRRHEADEETSLFPRLLGSAPPSNNELRSLIDRLSTEHRAHEELHARLERATTALQGKEGKTPEEIDRTWTELESVAELLTRGYRTHIEEEEKQLFPEARTLLSAAALDEMRAEMDARRDR